MTKKHIIISLICIITTFLWNCSSNIEIASKWAEQSITVDGIDDDWKDKTFYVKEENLLIGVQNDNEYLYLSVITANRNVQTSIVGRGLTVWFDREGEEDKKFGVKFPLGFIESGMMQMDRNVGEENKLNQMFAKEQTELEILIPDNDEKTRMSLIEAKGIAAKIGYKNDKMVYEMKIALRVGGENLYGISIKENNLKISVGLETPEIDREEIREKIMSGEGGNIDREKIREKMGNRNSGMRRSGIERLMPESLSYWFNVQLVHKQVSLKIIYEN